jgi:hypothetical protein
MRAALLVLATAFVGCSTDASGLGGDLVVLDAEIDDSTIGDETRPLFPDEDATSGDSGESSDSASPDASPDSGGIDTELPDVFMPPADSGIDTELPDTEPLVDSKVPDTAVDDAPDGDVSYPLDVMESDGGFTPSTGRVVCHEGGVDKLCASGEVCCNTSSGWKCTTTCGTLGLGGYKCDEKADCPSGQVCCADITPFIGTWNGTYCTVRCFTAEMCMASSDCPSGKTCTPVKPTGAPYTMGYCK